MDYSKITKVFKDQKKPDDNIPFTDDIFPPNFNSILGKNKSGEYIDPIEGPLREKIFDENEIEWKRASEIFPEPHLFDGELTTNNIVLGKIGSPYFLSSIISISKYPGLLSKIFITNEYNPDGFYSLIMFIDGEYLMVMRRDRPNGRRGTR